MITSDNEHEFGFDGGWRSLPLTNEEALDNIRHDIERDIEPFQRYLELVERFLEKERQKYEHIATKQVEEMRARKEYEEFTNLYPPNSGVYPIVSTDHMYLESDFPEILRRSLFVAIYNFTEHKLMDLCRIYPREDLKITHQNLKGEGIERVHTYLTKVLGINIPNDKWRTLKDYALARNCIVHADGVTSHFRQATDQNQLIEFSKSEENFDIHEQRIHIQQGFCEKFIKIVAELLIDLEQRCWEFQAKKTK